MSEVGKFPFMLESTDRSLKVFNVVSIKSFPTSVQTIQLYTFQLHIGPSDIKAFNYSIFPTTLSNFMMQVKNIPGNFDTDSGI